MMNIHVHVKVYPVAIHVIILAIVGPPAMAFQSRQSYQTKVLWAKLYFCMCKPCVHGQNFLFIVCLHLQTAFSRSKLLLCIGKLMLAFANMSSWAIFVFVYLYLQTRYSWSNSMFADISMPMTKRHVLVLASSLMRT